MLIDAGKAALKRLLPIVERGDSHDAEVHRALRSLHPDIVGAATPLISRLVKAGAQLELQLFLPEKQCEVWTKAPKLPDDVAEGVNRYVNELMDKPYWSDISSTLSNKVAEVIRDGALNKRSPETVAARVKEILGPLAADSKAQNIATTEVNGALNAGAQEAREHLADAGTIKHKQWFTNRDGHQRATHDAAHNQIRQVKKTFTVGGYACMFPGDPVLPAEERCQCRCKCLGMP